MSELYRSWEGHLPHLPTRARIDEEHKVNFYAALARDADLTVDLLTQHRETTARHLEAIAPEDDAEPSALDTIADGPRPGGAAPVP